MATAVRKLPVSYYRLVRRFPLVHLRNDDELAAATEIMHALSARDDLDEGEEAYFDLLCELIGGYEDDHHPIPDASEAEVLAFLLESNKLSPAELAAKVGVGKSVLEAVLAEDRAMTRGQIQKVAAHFHVSPGVFMAKTDSGGR